MKVPLRGLTGRSLPPYSGILCSNHWRSPAVAGNDPHFKNYLPRPRQIGLAMARMFAVEAVSAANSGERTDCPAWRAGGNFNV